MIDESEEPSPGKNLRAKSKKKINGMMRERRSKEGSGNELGQSRLTARQEDFKSSEVMDGSDPSSNKTATMNERNRTSGNRSRVAVKPVSEKLATPSKDVNPFVVYKDQSPNEQMQQQYLADMK